MATDRGDPVEPAQALYGVAPADFVAAREEAVKAARTSGDRELAAQLKALRRPTPAAWMVNALVRDDRSVLADFLALGAALAEAQSALRGEELRALSAQRSALVTSLVARAERLAASAGVRIDSAATGEVHDSLVAALVDEHAAEQVRGGRLVRGLSYSGFGVEPDAAAVPVPPRPAPSRDDEQRAERRRVAVEQAQQRVVAAELAESTAADAHAQLEAALAEERERVRDLERRAAEAALAARAAAGAARMARKDLEALTRTV